MNELPRYFTPASNERYWKVSRSTVTVSASAPRSNGFRLLEARGPQLGHPQSSGITTSRHVHMRELCVQYQGRPVRVLYAFDPPRVAILLIGGDKTGRGRGD